MAEPAPTPTPDFAARPVHPNRLVDPAAEKAPPRRSASRPGEEVDARSARDSPTAAAGERIGTTTAAARGNGRRMRSVPVYLVDPSSRAAIASDYASRNRWMRSPRSSAF